MAADPASLVTYRGNCHCGSFIFEVELPELKQAYECNCSICSKKGYLWQFPPPGGFRVVKGDPDAGLTTYRFANMTYQHKFCPNCGTAVLAVRDSGPPDSRTGINVRVLQDISVWSIATQSFPGAGIDPQYQAPVFDGLDPVADVKDGKIYHGSCHCGAVKMAVKTKPLDHTYDERIIEGDCSICSRGAYIWIYPKTDQISVTGREHLSYYAFATTVWRKAFCKICGVHLMNELNPKTDEEVAALPEKDQQWRARLLDYNPITLRCLNDTDWRVLKTQHHNCAKMLLPEYVNP